MTEACATIVEAIIQSDKVPLTVGFDGRSGAGKSTLVFQVAAETGAAIVPLDDFFTASIAHAEWDRMTVAARGRHVFDWARIRAEAIGPLRAGRTARWHPFDFDAGPRADGTYGMKTSATEVEPAAVILIDGAYSTGPQLADLIGLTVLVETPDTTRWARLARREEAEFLAQWRRRWEAVEDFYFAHVRPRSAFDLIVTT